MQLAIEAGDEAVYPGVVELLSSQGRMKYLRPLYRWVRQLNSTPINLVQAKTIGSLPTGWLVVGL